MVLLTLAAVQLVFAANCVLSETEEQRMNNLEEASWVMARQLMKQQLYAEEMIRGEGDSGLKQVRFRHDGPKPYNTATHTGWSMAAMHDHPEFERMCGLGEFSAVLNGVEFRTRHNDYTLVRPSKGSSTYHQVEDIPYPAVPEDVTSLPVADQAAEMREYFKAWRDSNHTHRDYRPYFKANLCYLEGAWTMQADMIDEPFDSIRHQLEADNWEDMFDKIRFNAYTGDKSLLENLAQLPSMLLNISDGVPSRAQWNYRILCHQIKGSVKLTEFEVVEDLGKRLSMTRSMERYRESRASRFSLDPSSVVEFSSRLDQIMAEIPGKDNYKASITDSTLQMPKLRPSDDAPLNTGFYHRWFKLNEKGAMGDNTIHRAFNDRNLFVAETTQPEVAPMSVKLCKYPNKFKEELKECEIEEKRLSYAIPLEIVYQTPLQAWNPYGIVHKGHYKSELGMTASANRTGAMTPEEAYDGTNNKLFYRTPVDFFSSSDTEGSDSADTTRKSVGVLDSEGNVREVTASGIRIFLPEIPGVGSLRLRYPIMPLFMEGSPIWKELEALRDLVLDMQNYQKYLYSSPEVTTAAPEATTPSLTYDATAPVLLTTAAAGDPLHFHVIELNDRQYNRLVHWYKSPQYVNRTTSDANGHAHFVKITYVYDTGKFVMELCDNLPQCPDGHRAELNVLKNDIDGLP